jgi:putative endonuclease
MPNKEKGKYGEDVAVKYLEKQGYKILERNFRYSKYGEIDIIATKNLIISAIEVKARSNNAFGEPLEAVTPKKLEKINATFQYYLSNTKIIHTRHQIDAISIMFNKGEFEIKHVKNIEF